MYGVSGVPCSVMVAAPRGTILNINAMAALLSDPRARRFPWASPPKGLVSREAQVLTLASESLGLAAVKEARAGRLTMADLSVAKNHADNLRGLVTHLAAIEDASTGVTSAPLQPPALEPALEAPLALPRVAVTAT